MLCLGCTSTTQVQAGRHDQFRNALVDTCRLIQKSEFDQARSRLSASRSLAMDSQQRAKVDDLERMISGAEAMHSGIPSSAADSWLAIDNVDLKQQVVDLNMSRGIDLNAMASDEDHVQEKKP